MINQINRRHFLASAATVATSLASFELPAIAAEEEPQLESLRLNSGRRMSYRQLGSGDKNLMLIHGFPGSSRQFLNFNNILHEHGISALAPNLYGEKTDWNKRTTVMDTGRDIADLFHALYGKNSKVITLCVSAGAKDGIAATVALNSIEDRDKVSALYVVSGQMDLGRQDTFSLLSREKQFEFNCIRGVSKRAVLPVFQPIRNIGGRLRSTIAQRRLEGLCSDPKAAYEKVIGAMSMSADLPVLQGDPRFDKCIYQDIAEYSAEEIVDSIKKLFNWQIDFRALQGTKVTIIHGTEDKMVPPKNAQILNSELRRASIKTDLLWYPDGHLLLKKRSEEIGERILKEDF